MTTDDATGPKPGGSCDDEVSESPLPSVLTLRCPGETSIQIICPKVTQRASLSQVTQLT